MICIYYQEIDNQFDISAIIRPFQVWDSNKDNISTCMIQICDSSIAKPLSIIFGKILNSGIFPDNLKKSNIVPVHKKGNKLLITNYYPVPLLSISRRIFVKLIFDSLYKFVGENSRFCSSQSAFRKTDSCVNQILSIVHKIFR